MKQTSIILLLFLLLFPIIWNGISLVHHVVEHTHTFCDNDLNHSHQTPDNCLSVFELGENNNQSQLPSTIKIEFQELKQYLSPNMELNTILLQSFQKIIFFNPSFPNDLFAKEVFHPPIFA